jgi:heavy metal sensor kinase
MVSSIKAKVVLFYMVVLFVILSGLGIFLYFSLSRIVYDSIDASLLSKAKTLATLVKDNGNETEFNFSDEVLWEYSSPKSMSFFQIRRVDGTILEKSESVGKQELPFSDKTTFQTIHFKGKIVRMMNFHVPAEEGHAKKGHGLIIQCAEGIGNQIGLLKTYKVILSLSVIGILIISSAGGFLIARKALTPVKEISRAIDKISETNLSERITPENIPEELKVLASSFNRTFDRLERSFNRQRQFVSDASHELRTPLSVIISQSEIILRRERSAEEYKNGLTAILEASKLMSGIIHQLLTLARLGTDRIELKMESLDLGAIMNEAVGLLKPLAALKGIAISIPAEGPHVISGDRASLLELFSNIIDNAIKYNIPQGKIDISIKKEPGFIVTEVQDTGIGIPERDLDKVFDRFYRVDKARSKDISGIGLGLSICEEIVKLHGGRIEIKSKVGMGTIVRIYFKDSKKETRNVRSSLVLSF